MHDEGSARYREALQRGHEAVSRGRPREAIRSYEEAARLAPRRPLPYASMGAVFLQMRRAREALRAFEAALERAPGDIGALRGKAAALEAEGRAAEASTLLQRAAELEAMERAGRAPGAPDGRRLELERRVAEGDAARVAGDLDRAAAAYHAAALGYAAEGAFDPAIDACMRALEARPGAIDVHFTMAHLYLSRGWANLGVQRLRLIEHRLEIDADPRRRAALRALAHDFEALAPELADLAAPALPA